MFEKYLKTTSVGKRDRAVKQVFNSTIWLSAKIERIHVIHADEPLGPSGERREYIHVGSICNIHVAEVP